MNRTSTFLVCLLICGVVFAHSSTEAESVYLESGWYAHLTNVQWLCGGWDGDPPQWQPFGGITVSSEHITASSEAGTVSFDVTTSGWADLGETAYVFNGTLDPTHKVGPIAFDWSTSWESPASDRLRLEVWTISFDYSGPGTRTLIWSEFTGAGARDGSEFVDGTPWAPNGYEIHLAVAVPEPSSVPMLGTGMIALGCFSFRHRRAPR